MECQSPPLSPSPPRPSPLVAAGLCCPRCRQDFVWQENRGPCACGARPAWLHANQVPDFLNTDVEAARPIWGWPADFLHRLEPELAAQRRGLPLSPEAVRELQAAGLMDQESHVTPLGATCAYHLAEYRVQRQADQFLPAAFTETIGPDARVADIGCGAGQTLRRLKPGVACELVGIDSDLVALALGCRLAQSHGLAIAWVRASGAALPFRDGRFTHVFCRVALNYMHQGRALREMARVLQPGGFFFGYVEGPGFDWRLLRTARGFRARASRMRDLTLGAILAATGWQPTPGGRFSGGRVFGTPRRYRNLLTRAGCQILDCRVTTRRWGLADGFTLLARKRVSA